LSISRTLSISRSEISPLIRLAAPIVFTQVSMMTMGMVDIWMVSRLGTTSLAAVALGDSWVFGTVVIAQGLIQGLDPLVTQAHGARDPVALGRSLQRGILLALCLLPVVTLSWQFAQDALMALGQAENLVTIADQYVNAQIFSLPAFLGFFVLKQYLQGRGRLAPLVATVIVANLFNVVFNELFIFGGLGIPALGVEGAAYATGASRWLMLLGMIFLTVRGRYLQGGWVPWSRRSFSPRAMKVLLLLGLPISVHFGVEVWTFNATTLMAGQLGETQIAAHIVVLKIISFTFMFPWGISGAATTRVGNLLGAADPVRARQAGIMSLLMAALVMTVLAAAILLLNDRLLGFFSDDPLVLTSALALLPIAAGFQIFDGVQAVGAGVLRGAGQTIPAAAIGVIGFPCLTLPLAYHLAFRIEMGLAGIWWAFFSGLVVVAILLVSWFLVVSRHWKPLMRRIGEAQHTEK